MRFSVIINKTAIFYFFIQNLSEWHFSNRPDYNELWRQEFGSFTAEEESTLKKMKEIHLRYPFGRSYLGRDFFLEQNPWTNLKRHLKYKDFIDLKNIFSVFEGKFNLFWSKESTLLSAWKRELERNLNYSPITDPVIDQLKIIFNASPSQNEIKIYLLPSTEKHTGGGANIDSKSITLEISRSPLSNINQAISVIWHEIVHLSFQKQYFFPLLLKSFPNDRKKIDLINEIVARSLFPRGIMAVRLLKKSRRINLVEKSIQNKQLIF